MFDPSLFVFFQSKAEMSFAIRATGSLSSRARGGYWKMTLCFYENHSLFSGVFMVGLCAVLGVIEPDFVERIDIFRGMLELCIKIIEV